MTETEIREIIQELSQTQSLAVLATSNNGQPYGSLVGFATTADLSEIIFASLRNTNKCHNIESEPRVSLTIDNRNNKSDDFDIATALTAIGQGKLVIDDPDGSYRRIMLGKLPELQEFLDNPDCVLISIAVEKYVLVSGIYQCQILEINQQ